ncbi:MAG: M14 family metallopeptidase [Acidobacteriota bacterium]|nr:M14 family metallopeptidase [Acidobacteriota bacterium]
MRSGLLAAAATAALGLLLPAGAAHAAQSYDQYHHFADVERQLQAWSKDRPETKLLTIGRSAGGRPLYVLRVALPGEPQPDARQAVFVGANAAGFHNAGTEAALHLLETLLKSPRDGQLTALLSTHTFYIAPVLNPDAHDAIFQTPRMRRGGNDMVVDHDNDGLAGEDPPDDLDGNGVITSMRIPDPTGDWLPDPQEPRLMIRADAIEEHAGAYRVYIEGKDDDGDGQYNEDPKDGVWVDRNFPHAFPYPAPEAGPWPGYAPETRAIMDFLLPRRNVALAIVYGPGNNLLAMPQGQGGGGDLGTQTFKVPERFAKFLGLDPEKDYTIDQVWELVKDLPIVRQNGADKDQLAQFLGGGPATKVDADDQAYLEKFATAYKERLKKAGLADDRPGAQYSRGGITPWLYYQYGATALELDVWGIPHPEKSDKDKDKDRKAGDASADALTLDKLAAMSSEQFLALPVERVAAFMKENKVPAQFTPQMAVDAVKSGKIDPKGMANQMRQMGAGGGGGGGGAGGGKGEAAGGKEGARAREVLAWVDAHAPQAWTSWKPVTLPDGTKAEVGGLDPFVEIAPPMEILKPALAVHTATVLDLAGKLAKIELVSLTAADLGSGIYRVKAVAVNRGYLPTHTKLAVRARVHLPVRLEIHTGNGVELVTNHDAKAAERLDGRTGTIEGEWLVKAAPGTKIEVEVISDNAGRDKKSVPAGKGA